jgi:hypothetical protein
VIMSDEFNIIEIFHADTLIVVQLESRRDTHTRVFYNFQDIDVIMFLPTCWCHNV